MSCHYCATASPSACHYCGCTQCGQPPSDHPSEARAALVCVTCGSRTHLRCARDAFTAQLLYPDAASSSSGGGGGSPSPPLHTLPPYHCSLDCRLQVEIYANPNVDTHLQAMAEEEMARRWRELLTSIGSSSPVPQPEGKSVPPLAPPPPPPTDRALHAAYLQLRYEAWRQYFYLERARHAHPLLLPPAYLAMGDELVSALHDQQSASGQARRLFLLDPAQFPAGAVVALPSDQLWRRMRPEEPGTTNSYVREAAADFFGPREVRVKRLKAHRGLFLPSSTVSSAAKPPGSG